jgi:hypothetical protein
VVTGSVRYVLGKMLWFNEVKHVGMIESDDGERFSVRREDFVEGAPVGRCATLPVTFERVGFTAVNVRMSEAGDVRRARRRSGSRPV